MEKNNNIIEEETKFCDLINNRQLILKEGNINDSQEYIGVPKKLLDDLKDFDFWKEWKNS